MVKPPACPHPPSAIIICFATLTLQLFLCIQSKPAGFPTFSAAKGISGNWDKSAVLNLLWLWAPSVEGR